MMPANIINTPPICTASNLSLFNTFFITQPKPSDAIISGNTIKKLKMPIYTPILPFGNTSPNKAYGIDKILAQAIPTPVIHPKSIYLFSTKATLINPIAPMSRQTACVFFLPNLLAIDGRIKANKNVTTL